MKEKSIRRQRPYSDPGEVKAWTAAPGEGIPELCFKSGDSRMTVSIRVEPREQLQLSSLGQHDLRMGAYLY
jgi:hypothetical protein